jgi:phage FluMu gp28-like protein
VFLPYQRAWIDDPAAVAIAEKSRRIGLTWAEAYRSVERRLALGTNHWFAAQDRESAAEFIDAAAKFARGANAVGPEEVVDEAGMRLFVLRFRNGARITALSSRPAGFRGKGGDVTLDEFAFHPEPREMLKAANAAARVWGHQVRILSTHNGESSLFARLVAEVRAGQRDWSLHHIDIQEAVAQGLVGKVAGDDSLAARKAFLDELRAGCVDEGEWREEYLCLPGSEQSSLLSYDLIAACERTGVDLPVAEDPREIKFNGPMYAGLDIGRQRDLTVFWVVGKVGDVYETRLVKRFARAEYRVQEEYLDLLLESQPNVRRLCIDSTGIGNMLAERACRRWAGRCEAVTFTAAVKADLALPLARLFEDRLIRVPADAATRESLHRVRKLVTASGNVRFDAARDEAGHADEFWALALAFHAADARRAPLPEPLERRPAWAEEL